MSNKQNETTTNQQVVNTSTDQITWTEDGQKITKKKYSKTRFQIKNNGDLINRKLPAVLSPEDVESIASTREKLQYTKNSTYKLVDSYVIDFRWEDELDDKNKKTGKRVKSPLAPEDCFRVGIYAVPKVHKLI